MPTKVLVVDDDTAITELLSLLLKSHGFEIVTANTGADGIRLAREENPGVVILDLMMPEKDGWEVCRALRNFSNVPVLMLSAINDPQKIASILDGGADDFLVKPVPSSVLVAHLRKLVRRTGGLEGEPESTPPVIQAGTQPLMP